MDEAMMFDFLGSVWMVFDGLNAFTTERCDLQL